MDKTVLQEFAEIVGTAYVQTDDETLKEYGKDHTVNYVPSPLAVVFPDSEKQISEIVKICGKQNIKIVPSGGRTGYAGGATAINGELVISLKRMNRITDIDPVSRTVTAEAGTIVENLQTESAKHGLYFPIDFAAKGSGCLGGIVSTNAGGLKVIRYGMTRQNILGLEVVLADGRILHTDSKLYKDNSGYDLKQLFIGAEGTLGIITAATVKLSPMPPNRQLALMATDNLNNIAEIVTNTTKANQEISAFEFFTSACITALKETGEQIKRPFAENYPFYILLEVLHNDREDLEEFAENLWEAKLIKDAVFAESTAQFKSLWALRENISEALNRLGQVHKNDVSVPVSSLPRYTAELETLFAEKYGTYELYIFGHVGDGNLHINLIDRNRNNRSFSETKKEFTGDLAELTLKYEGSLSAEHGIGLLKKELLGLQKDELQLELMKKIKKMLDPQNIFNPGKIIDIR